jgi:hypothetical protein
MTRFPRTTELVTIRRWNTPCARKGLLLQTSSRPGHKKINQKPIQLKPEEVHQHAIRNGPKICVTPLRLTPFILPHKDDKRDRPPEKIHQGAYQFPRCSHRCWEETKKRRSEDHTQREKKRPAFCFSPSRDIMRSDAMRCSRHGPPQPHSPMPVVIL